MNIVLLGPPGAGKGTTAKRLEKSLDIPHVSSGDLLRALRDEDTSLAKEVRSYMDQGKYVPDALTISLVLCRLAESDATRGFILDGFPRTRPQAEALDRALAERGSQLDGAIYINAPTDVLVRRITGRIICPECNAIYNAVSNPPRIDLICDVCGHGLERRSDELPEVIRVRLDTYRRQTQPLLDHYRKRGCLSEIDGRMSMEEVERDVDMALHLEGVS